ncbi:MAG TPA: type II and III secretion system protein, partial [Firmicutes bacterium]|nr:type II and III secretion system protein [Bacillota bacterium]
MQNKRLWTIVICLFVLALLSGAPVSAAEKVAVAVNQSRILTFTGVSQVAVANPDIADVSVVSGSEIILIGKAPGMTTLHIWSLTGRQSFLVEVGTDDTNIANAIRETLGYKDIRVSKINNNIILEGTVNDQY